MGAKSTSENDPITTAEAAAILRLSERQTRQHADNGNLPGRKLNPRTWVFRRGDVVALRGKLPRRGRPSKAKTAQQSP